MNTLIIGQNTKMAKVFSLISDNVYITIDKTNNNYRRYDEISEFPTIELNNITEFKNIFNSCINLKKIIHENNIDVIFTNEVKSMIVAYLTYIMSKKRKIILLSISHNSYTWCNNIKAFIYSYLIKFLTHGFVSLSSFVTNILISNNVNINRIFTTSNPIEQNLFECKTNYYISNNKPTLVYIGVQNIDKGQRTLIESINILKRKGIEVHLTLIGDIVDTNYHLQNLSYINDHNLTDNITFLGKVENNEIRITLHKYDLYICPSYMEMSPYNILEAKSAGLPIIATNVGGIPEIITNRMDGIIVNPKKPDELSDSIELLISNVNLRKEIGLNAYQNACRKHTPQNVADSLSQFISKLYIIK
ncbi:N,N'-diacetylbacillosaminyl-diphospho-undecaprenol alpha-1,3-N-acetylgalactosaminyltransferase [bioreactor metagenome]|uniref:N, N'-diacetylbacillosaminyl-diphospho-undecaprenol alpha-1,3-N-acetylgalactosaminyltransferase n=1 Tax=bioreactor metagenome TaxID=1076179 RepID=A0A644UJD1_9ZZZZ